jgi:ribulose-5-phosphate 4-epimerase/fuculose-1-phosphate aldolase
VTARADVALALRALAAEGFFSLPFGHLSVRAHADTILILRHVHDDPLPLTEVEATDVVALDLDGKPLEGVEGPGERFIHTEIYRRRPDVHCVLHYHSHATAALSLARQELVPRTPLGVVLGRRVPVEVHGGQIATPAKGETLAVALGADAAVLLPGHGAVVAAGSLEQLVARALALEDACAVELAAAQLGAPAALPADGRAEPPEAAEVSATLWRALLLKHGLADMRQITTR